MKSLICILFTVSKIFKMAARPRKHGMNRGKALAEIFADEDSDVSDFFVSANEYTKDDIFELRRNIWRHD